MRKPSFVAIVTRRCCSFPDKRMQNILDLLRRGVQRLYPRHCSYDAASALLDTPFVLAIVHRQLGDYSGSTPTPTETLEEFEV